MKILGITSGSESGVAAFESGELRLAVAEERLSREKFDHSYPHRALAWILDELGWASQDVQLIGYGFSSGLPNTEFFAAMMRRAQLDIELGADASVILERLASEGEVDGAKRDAFAKETQRRFPGTAIHRCSHHTAHAAGAIASSPFDSALVLTIDGRGDFESATISTARGNTLETRYRAFCWESLGYFYGRVTQLCGFTPNRHEGKITGLAAHGDPRPARPLMRKMIGLRNGQLRSSPGTYYRPFFSNFDKRLLAEAHEFSREDLAAAAQAHLESLVCELVRPHLRETGHRNICVAGGVFANVKLNQRLRELEEVDDVFVLPAMSDGGICIGAVQHYLLQHGDASRPARTGAGPYLGPTISPDTLRTALETVGFHVTKPESLEEAISNLLHNGETVALVQGRCEFGPRALGHRSILASARFPDVCDRINRRLRRTEFMPFAPVIAQPLASRCLHGYTTEQASSRHMTMAYDVSSEFARVSPAVVHVDNTARPQVLHRDDDAFLYRLLVEHHSRYEEPCLLNTSFNVHEEPIVCSESDVVQAALADTVDFIACPPYLARCTNREPK